MTRNFEAPTRSLSAATNGMAATSHMLATLAAVNILQDGGNAMDAAIAACAVQCVVEPGSTGVGGDCFVLLAPNGGDEVIAFNGSGRAPAAASAAKLRAEGLSAIPRQSPHAVTIPGAVDAWVQLNRDHGRKSLADIMRPAIRLAREGYAVTPRVAFDWANQQTIMRGDPDTAAIFLPEGRPPKVGETHRQPALAATLERIGAEGRDAFYKGTVAAEIVAKLQSLGGCHTLEDLAGAEGAYATPISTDYRGYTVHECPPNGQGVAALLILNILAGFKGAGDPLDPDRLHAEIEASRLAYAVRNAVVADPATAPVPLDWLLSDRLAEELRAQIDLTCKIADLPAVKLPVHSDTIYVSVVDKDRNAVSFINSLFTPWGSGIMAPESGVLLQNRGQGFSLEEGHPNELAGGKRPLHTIIPGMLTQNGRVVMPFGVMGGQYQALGHAHFLSKVLDYGLDLQTVIDLPRIFPRVGEDAVEFESSLPAATRAALAARGFNLVPSSGPLGGAQAIWIDWDNGTLIGGSDPRKDGCAMGY
jgi:gamma-glutamyltranspeptidase/glutathione hydrolase